MTEQINEDALLTEFVQCFDEDGAAEPFEGNLVIPQLTDKSALIAIYTTIPFKFPELFEELILSYRWYGADTGVFRLLPNPPGSDFAGFLYAMRKDKAIYEHCSKNGFVQMGWGTDFCYDPVCFDARKEVQDCNFPVVQLDHEEILCNSRIKVVEQLAISFRELVLKIILNCK